MGLRRSQRTASVIALLVGALLAVPGADAAAVRANADVTTPAAMPPAPARVTAAVVIGQTTYNALITCSGSPPMGAAARAIGGGAGYTVPSAGVITSWSTVGGGTAGISRLLLFVPGTVVNHKTLVAKSDYVPVTIGLGVVRTFSARIPVQAGQELGLGISVNNQPCALDAGIAGDSLTFAPYDADTTTDFAGSSIPGYRPNISAVVEPDVDGDGFGDVSQDLCPQSKLAQAACPAPDVTLTKGPKKKSSKRKATITFTSTVAGSTFTCAVDKKTAVPCTSPLKKKYTYGKHTVVLTATSPYGIDDPTPAIVKFKVKKPG